MKYTTASPGPIVCGSEAHVLIMQKGGQQKEEGRKNFQSQIERVTF